RYGGLATRMPKYALVFLFLTMAAVGLPGTGGFVGEFLVLLGVFQVNTWVAFFAATGLVLGAAYMLYLYRRVVFGRLTRDDLKDILDLSPREVAMFAPIIVLVIWMGVYPSTFLDPMHASVAKLIDNFELAKAATSGLSVAAR
ncbi:MAG: NADH-quinone oxidoreductase subunit M, partial [Rhodospirillaceae bacterium]|nr:NADH-quinone oxidoreductase subunit M [Rhodospirillales bacterium]